MSKPRPVTSTTILRKRPPNAIGYCYSDLHKGYIRYAAYKEHGCKGCKNFKKFEECEIWKQLEKEKIEKKVKKFWLKNNLSKYICRDMFVDCVKWFYGGTLNIPIVNDKLELDSRLQTDNVKKLYFSLKEEQISKK